MKRLTLNETWKLCLAMWKWIAEQRKKGNTDCVTLLKEQWLDKHHYKPDVIDHDCFFCEYDEQQDGENCEFCPARMAGSVRFHCGNKTYSWECTPIAFYNKLVSLNKKRKKK